MTELEKAAEALAEMYVERQSRPLTLAEKQAAPEDFLHGLGEHFQKNPILAKALLGGGLGAMAGGAAGAFGGEDDPRGRGKRMLSHALMGGLAGAATGGGIGAFQQYRGQGSEPAAPRPLTGSAFSKLPTEERAKQIQDIRDLSKPSMREQAAEKTKGVLGWMGENMPWTSTVAPVVGIGDLAHRQATRSGKGDNPADLVAGLKKDVIPSNIAGSPIEQALKETSRNAAETSRMIGRANPVLAGGMSPAPGIGPRNVPYADEWVRAHGQAGGQVPITRGQLRSVMSAGAKSRGSGGFGLLGRLAGYGIPMGIDAASALTSGVQSDQARRQAAMDKLRQLGVGG